jgi:hypothetical protein
VRVGGDLTVGTIAAVAGGVPVLLGIPVRLVLLGGVAVRTAITSRNGVLVAFGGVRACAGVGAAASDRTERLLRVGVAATVEVTGAVRTRFAVDVGSNGTWVLIASSAACATSRASTVGAGPGPCGSRPSRSLRMSLNQKMVVRAVSTTVIAIPLRVRRMRL